MLTLQIEKLLFKQIPFITVRIFETNSIYLPLGTHLLITHDEVWGSYPGHAEDLVNLARKALQNGTSETIEYKHDTTILKVCLEYMLGIPTMVIVGAGHIAVPLNQVAKMLGFRTIILDDREEYANKERFPNADQVIVKEFVDGLREISLDSNTYLVLITRGHVYDKDCLKAVLPHKTAYIGMICSQRRRASVFELMEKEGYTRQALEQIHAPIGLPIGGETPEEIAISIISEIVALRNRGKEWVQTIKIREAKHA